MIHKYVPDILVTYQDGSKEVIEVKPSSGLEEEKNISKIESFERYCEEKGFSWSVWTEKEIFERVN